MFVAWLMGMTMQPGGVCSVQAGDEVKTTATKTGGVTVYSDNKNGSAGTDVKAGPVTTSTTPVAEPAETVTSATRIGNVTELTGSKGTKSTMVTVGPMTAGQVNGKDVSVVRMGENVAVGTNSSGGKMTALQVGNQVVVQGSGKVSTSETRIIVQLLQEPVAGRELGGDAASGLELASFTKMDVAGEVTVEIESGPAFDISVSKNMKEYGTLTVEQGLLRIRAVDNAACAPGSRRVALRMPQLGEVTAGDGARVAIRNLEGERFFVTCQGGARIETAGKVKTVQCRVSGGGQVLAPLLHAGRMSVRLEGDGEVHCRAEQELVVMISGKGVVWCHGKPGLVTQKITGGGELRFEK